MLDFVKMALQYIPQYFTELLEVLTGPKAFLAKQDPESPEVVQRAWVFYGISMLIGTIAMMPTMPRSRATAELFVVSLATSAITLLLSLLLVKLSWRVVGGKANLKATFSVYAYVAGPALRAERLLLPGALGLVDQWETGIGVLLHAEIDIDVGAACAGEVMPRALVDHEGADLG